VGINSIAIFAFGDLFSLGVVETCKMFVVDIFDKNPFYLEVTLEFKSMVLPPERKSLLMVTRT
jgi:hypothetical protein